MFSDNDHNSRSEIMRYMAWKYTNNWCSSFQQTNQLTNWIPWRWVTRTYTSAVVVAHRHLSSVMRIGEDSDWPVHPFMLAFHDFWGLPLWRPPSSVPCNMVSSSVSYQQIWPNCDNLRRLTVDSWHLARTMTCCHIGVCLVFLVWDVKHTPSCSICFHRLEFVSLDRQSTSCSYPMNTTD